MPDDRAPVSDDSHLGERDAAPGVGRIRFIGESYRLLFEKNPLPMWVFDVKSLRFLAVNDAAVARYGYSRDEFLRLTIRDLRPLEDLPALDRELERLASDTESFGIGRHRTKGGRIIHVELLANEIDFNNHRARIVLAHDITEQLRIEKSLRTGYAVTRVLESAASFHDAAPKILEAVCEEAGWEYGEFWRVERDALRWDESWSIPGFPAEELRGPSGTMSVRRGFGVPGTTWATGRPQWLTDLTPASHFHRTEPAARLGIQQALSFPIAGHGPRVLGVMVFFSRSLGDPDEAFLDLMTDLGNRAGQFLEAERAEADRRRAAELFSKAFHEGPAAAAITRLSDGAIVDVNDSFLRTYGYTRDEVIGKPSRDLEIWSEPGQRERILGPARRGEAVRGIEETFRTKSGRAWTALVFVEPIHLSDEPSILTTLVDVTNLRQAQQQLLESEQLASIGRTASYVAHELNTPLTNIALVTASLRRQSQDPAVHERLDRIDVQRRLASRIIEEILSFTRASAIQKEGTDLAALLRAAAAQAAAFRKGDVGLDLNLGDEPVVTAVDPLKMSQALVNLIKNAYEATERGRVTVSLARADGTVRIRVRDTGRGMSPEDRARLFQAFFTTKPHGKGLGLGLTFVKAVVEAHGGRIDVTTEPEKGCTFDLVLPATPAAS